MSLMAQLKQDTAEIHQRVESQLRFLRPDFTLSQYREVLLQFLGFYRSCEDRLQAATVGTELESFVCERLKSPSLEQDLALLGCGAEAIDRAPRPLDLPNLPTSVASLGMMYVLEGATLGGAIIERHLRQHFGWGGHVDAHPPTTETDKQPLHFFGLYGAQVGQRWRAFVALTESQASERNSPLILESACHTFTSFERWLHGNSQHAEVRPPG